MAHSTWGKGEHLKSQPSVAMCLPPEGGMRSCCFQVYALESCSGVYAVFGELAGAMPAQVHIKVLCKLWKAGKRKWPGQKRGEACDHRQRSGSSPKL